MVLKIWKKKNDKTNNKLAKKITIYNIIFMIEFSKEEIEFIKGECGLADATIWDKFRKKFKNSDYVVKKGKKQEFIFSIEKYQKEHQCKLKKKREEKKLTSPKKSLTFAEKRKLEETEDAMRRKKRKEKKKEKEKLKIQIPKIKKKKKKKKMILKLSQTPTMEQIKKKKKIVLGLSQTPTVGQKKVKLNKSKSPKILNSPKYLIKQIQSTKNINSKKLKIKNIKKAKTTDDINYNSNIVEIYNSLRKERDDFIEKKIDNLMEKSFVKKWLKKINLNNELSVEEFNKELYFKKVANIIIDNEMGIKGKKKGIKLRKTVIKFDNIICQKKWSVKNEWIYLFVLNNKIIKIGGSRVGLKNRVGSYLCGHHTKERGGSGKMSVTNAFIYNTFEFYLKLGYKLEMYAYEIPEVKITIDILNKKKEEFPQLYHIYESEFKSKYKKETGHYPFLSDNSDPDYRT